MLFSPVGFKGNLSLLEIGFSSGGLKQMEVQLSVQPANPPVQLSFLAGFSWLLVGCPLNPLKVRRLAGI